VSDVYRVPGYACPRCRTAALRVYGERLVCDECHGMMLGGADFLRACEYEAAAPLTLAFLDEHTESARGGEEHASLACPRCTRALQACTVELGGRAYKTAMLRCESDGVWIDVDKLVALLALIHRKHGGGFFRGTSGPGGPGLRMGPNGLPVRPLAPAAAGLRISEWRHHHPVKRPKPPAVDPYADRTLRCPACEDAKLAFAGDRWVCGTCSGAFVQNPALTALVQEMVNQPWELPAPTGAAGPRPCPVCTQPMLVETLEAVAIDRCEEHGLWFDQAELGALLEHAGEPSRGVGAWLRGLFG
jgi:Zn-finger nucleic acid-binding protein/ribosomal protein S27AE